MTTAGIVPNLFNAMTAGRHEQGLSKSAQSRNRMGLQGEFARLVDAATGTPRA
jgi:hypothetical protein